MKDKFIKIISSLLLIAFLVSCLSVFAFAEESEEEEEALGGTLIINRNFDEGWPHSNGFGGSVKNNYFGVEHEETTDFKYNYFVRIEATNDKLHSTEANDGYMELQYKSNRATKLSSVLMFDIRVDDYVDLGTVVYARSIGGSSGFSADLVSFRDGKMYIPNVGVATTSAQNSVGAIENDRWVTLAIVYNLSTNDAGDTDDENYRICPTCYTKYLKTDCKGQDCGKSYKDTTGVAKTGCAAKLDPDTMLQLVSTRIYVGYADEFDIETATEVTLGESDITTKYVDDDVSKVEVMDTTDIDLSIGTRYFDTSYCIKANQTRGTDIVRFGLPARKTQADSDNALGQSYCLDNVKAYNLDTYIGPYVDDKTGETKDNYADILVSFDEVATLATADKPYGENVAPNASKTVDILSGSGEKSDLQYITEALLMKVGTEYGRFAGERKAILSDANGVAYGAPVKIDGLVYVPFQAVLNHIGYPIDEHEDGYSYDFATSEGSALIAIDRPTATVDGKSVPLTAAPKRITDEKTGQPYVVIAMDDIETLFPGYYITYDEMGLIILAEKDDLVNRADNLSFMVELMASFIYDFVSGDTYYDMAKEHTNNFQHPYLLVESQDTFDYYREVYYSQPGDENYDENLQSYLQTFVTKTYNANGSANARVNDTYVKFRHGLRYWAKDGVWVEGQTDIDDSITLDAFGGSFLRDELIKYTYEKVNAETGEVEILEDGSWINGTLVNPHDSELAQNSSTYNGGYDWDGGRLNESVHYNNYIRDLALCYQITGKQAYGYLAYEAAVKMATWTHWGQGHFLNCADATTPYALAYDWMYNDWKAWGLDLGVIEDAIYRLGVYHGSIVSAIEGTRRCEINNRRQGTSAYYTTMVNNWNVVCTSGMVTGSLAILGIKDVVEAEGRANPDYDYDRWVVCAKYLLENNTRTLATGGLGMYAPDGSYIESPNYWRYSTNSLFHMIWVLNTAVGDDMGFLNMWGMETTFLFACQIEFPSSIRTDDNRNYAAGVQFWNYHDSGQECLDTHMFFYAAQMLGQESLAALRIEQIPKKGVVLYDILGYKPEYKYLDVSEAKNELALSYKIDSCDGAVARDTWGDGALYVGLMGNNNDASHGQVDSGNFIYANKNYVWFCDLGAENYNVYKYFSNEDNSKYRYSYTRMNAEGANVICLTSEQDIMPFGQSLSGGGKLVEYEANENGMITVIDNTTAYGSVTNYAKRGLLFTNNRKTVVIQDEISFAGGSQSVKWLGVTGAQIILSADKKTAWLKKTIGDEEAVIRCTIVSNSSSMMFSVLTAQDYVLDTTMRPNQSLSLGGVDEKDRSLYQRLCISHSGLGFECAVVIEEVENEYINSVDFPPQYKWTPMNQWEIAAEYTEEVKDESVLGNASLADIQTYGDMADRLVRDGYAFTTRTNEFFFNMAKAAACVAVFGDRMIQNSGVKELVASYNVYVGNLAKYNAYQAAMNVSNAEKVSLGAALGGFKG